MPSTDVGARLLLEGHGGAGCFHNPLIPRVAVHALKRVEELRGPPVDSYDKLIAWLSEMAESDNVHLDTSVFVKQLTTVCRNENSTSNGLSNLAAGGSDRGSSSSTGLTAGARRSATLRQNSASCESRASSSDTHHFSTGRSTYSRLVFFSVQALMHARAASSAVLQDEDHSEGVQSTIRLPNKVQWSALFQLSSYLAPVIWNQLPVSVRRSTSVSSSKKKKIFKTFLFLKTFSLVPLL